MRYLSPFLTCLLVCVLVASVAQAGLFSLEHTLDDTTPTSTDQFGFSVALDGNYVLVGAPYNDIRGVNVGRMFSFNATSGAPMHIFDNPTITGGDLFGAAVAINANRVLAGAPFSLGGQGRAHLFDANTGGPLLTFNNPTPTGADQFGFSVALEGNYVIVGAPFNDSRGANVGRAFSFNATTGAPIRTFDNPTITGGDLFGYAVALNANRVLVGAPFSLGGTGRAHLLDANSGGHLLTFNNPTPTGPDGFGSSVALDGNYVLVGAPLNDFIAPDVGRAFLFDATSGAHIRTFDNPTPTPPSDEFGKSVAIHGTRVLIGAPFNDANGSDVGRSFLFDANTGALLRTFDDPSRTRDWSGSSVALGSDRVVIGAPSDDTLGGDIGQAYIFLEDVIGPTVTINQAAGQSDPTAASPVHFTVVFNESVSDFTSADVMPAGTAGATTAVVTGSGTTYDVAVSGMTGAGTIIMTVRAGVAHDASANANSDSTSTDNTVTFTSGGGGSGGGSIVTFQ